MYQLRSVKRSLTLDSRRALATEFVAKSIDQCNGVLTVRCRDRSSAASKINGFERCCETRCWHGTVQPRHSNPPWCPPLTPCTASNQLKNCHTGSGLYSRHRPGLFRWRLRSGDCSPWTNQPAFSDASRSLDPSNTNTIGRTEFPYIRTDGVELSGVARKLRLGGQNWGRSPNRGREAPENWGRSPNRGRSPRFSGGRGLGRGLGEPLPRKF